MKPEEQKIAIAEACPHLVMKNSRGVYVWRNKWENAYDDDRLIRVEFDPLEDLNAMHEAEKVLTDEQYAKYALWLGPLTNERARAYISAIAAERSEAFCRTLGLWRENQS